MIPRRAIRCGGWTAGIVALVLLGVPGMPLPADAATATYAIDQRYGSIRFTVRHLGVFASTGRFDRFRGSLEIDPAHPDHARIKVVIDAASLDMAWSEAAAMLRSSDFFDVAHYPTIVFRSIAVVPLSDRRYRIDGQLDMRGIRRAQDFEAVLLDTHTDSARHRRIAEFAVSGALARSDYGMRADRLLISDQVRITIRIRIETAVVQDGVDPHWRSVKE